MNLEQWCVVELMGHVRIAGKLSEEEKFGAKMGRLDIPQTNKPGCPNCQGREAILLPCPVCHGGTFVTQYFGGGSVYRITFCSEEAARLVAKQSEPSPVHPWEMPRLTSQPVEHPVREPVMEYDDNDLEDERRPF